MSGFPNRSRAGSRLGNKNEGAEPVPPGRTRKDRETQNLSSSKQSTDSRRALESEPRDEGRRTVPIGHRFSVKESITRDDRFAKGEGHGRNGGEDKSVSRFHA